MTVTPDLAISVRGLTKRFKGQIAVKGCSIDVPYGAIYGFLGPNGSGKTTTIRMLCGLLTPDAGEGACLGYDIRKQSAAIKRQAGYMPQKFGLYEDLTIRENLEFVARLYEMPDPQQVASGALHRLGLEHRASQLAGELSGGWKQRLSLAACILHAPRLLLLDEPTAGVDPKARREFWDEIHAFAAQGITVLVSTHYMDEAERCHLIGYIFNGRLLVHGPVPQVVAQSGITTWRLTTKDSEAVKRQLQGLPGVEMVTSFGDQIHVAGTDAAALEATINKLKADKQITAEQIPPTLEDAFIHTVTHVNAGSGAEGSS
jgi:ABC-2 type transport system ATP-binding protein